VTGYDHLMPSPEAADGQPSPKLPTVLFRGGKIATPSRFPREPPFIEAPHTPQHAYRYPGVAVPSGTALH
jgi:hypothetical protein